jgi:argininosuccinate synthase
LPPEGLPPFCISAAGTTSPYSLYNTSIASFTTGDLYNHADAKGFIRLYGLPVLVRALMQKNSKAVGKTAKPGRRGRPPKAKD